MSKNTVFDISTDIANCFPVSMEYKRKIRNMILRAAKQAILEQQLDNTTIDSINRWIEAG
ncbi:MAG: hypothetical protein WC119_00055 [Synergistaceae bacterium]